MELTPADSGEVTNNEPLLVKVHSASDVLSVPEKGEVNSSAATSLLHHDPFERENTAFSKGDNSFSSTDKGISDLDGSHQVESAQLDCRIESNKSTEKCSDDVAQTHSTEESCREINQISESTNEICGKSNDEFSSPKSSVSQNQNAFETKIDSNDMKANLESGIDRNKIPMLGTGRKLDEMKDNSEESDVSASAMNCEDGSDKNDVVSRVMEQNQMVQKSDLSENSMPGVCNGPSHSENADVTTNENVSSDIEPRKEIENDHIEDVDKALQNQVACSVNDTEKNCSQFQKTNSEAIECEKNKKLTDIGDNTEVEGSQEKKDTCLQEKAKTKAEEGEKDNLNMEKIENKSFTKEKSNDTNEEKKIEDNIYTFEEEKSSKKLHKNLVDINMTETTKLQNEESTIDNKEKSDSCDEVCETSVATGKDQIDLNNQGKGECSTDIKDCSYNVKTNSECVLNQENGDDSNMESSDKVRSDLSHIHITNSLPEKESCESGGKLSCEKGKETKDNEKLDNQKDDQKNENFENMTRKDNDHGIMENTVNFGSENDPDKTPMTASEIKNDVVCSDVGNIECESVMTEISATENKIINENMCDRDLNSKPTEIKIKKKRGRKPKSVTNQNLSVETALDLSETKDSDNEKLKSSISPTRSGRKSYKKLNKEFLYDYETGDGENDVKFSSHQKKSDFYSPKKSISLELENSDIDSDILKTKNSSYRHCENLKHSSPLNIENSNLQLERLPRACTPKGSAILYKCMECKFESTLRTNFKEHLCIHLGYKPIYCNKCEFRTCHKNNIFSHCANMHGDRNDFKVVTELDKEQFLVARVKECRKFVPKKYVTHTKNLKKRISATKIKTSGYKKVDCHSASENLVKCPYCMFQAHSNSSIKKHIVWKHKIFTYQCQLCEFSSFLKTEVSLHISNKHGGDNCSPIKSLKPRTEVEENESEGLKNLEGSLGPKNLDTSLGPYWNQTNSVRKRFFKSGTIRIENFKKKSNLKEKYSQFPRKPKRMEKCRICGFESIAIVGIRRHMYFRHKLCSWVCTGCSATFPQKDEAVCHTQMYHSGQHVKISRTLPEAPSRVSNTGGKKILSSLDSEVKIARKMKKRSNLYSWQLKKQKNLHTDLNSISPPQNDVEKSGMNSELKTEFSNSIPGENLKEESRINNIENSNFKKIMKSEMEHNDYYMSDVPAGSDTAPFVGDISNSVTVPRKPGRPKLNKTDCNSKIDIELQMTDALKVQKKRGRKRKAESLTGDGLDNSSGNIKKFRKSLKSDKLILSNDSSFDCISDISVENCNKTIDILMNSSNAGTPVSGKKRGPKKKTLSSNLFQSVDMVHLAGENESKGKTTGIKQEEKSVFNNFMCGAANDSNAAPGPKTPKSKIIMTVADVHQSDFKSDSELSKSYSKDKNVCAVPSMESDCEKQNQIADFSPSKLTCGLNEEKMYSQFNDGRLMYDFERKQKLKLKKMKNLKTCDLDSSSGSCLQSENEKFGGNESGDIDHIIKIKKKRGRKKKIEENGEGDENAIWSNWKSSSYVLHPKKIDKVQVAYSCPYCNYAAPLRHQLRLHCYGRHTDRPACLIEFKIKRKPGRPPGKPNSVKLSPKQVNKSKSSSPCKETNQNVNEGVFLEGSEMSPSLPPKKTIKKRFNNPLKPMVRQLNGCRVRVYDTFHSCVDIDDVDRYLDKFGVRTLNMDMLTPKQFSKFMSKFGGNLQGVDL